METSRWLAAFFEWQLPLSSVPLGNALLSDLLVATSVLDTPIDEDGDSSYAFVRHPKSLRTNLYVIVDRGHEAFDAAHTHMAAIKAQVGGEAVDPLPTDTVHTRGPPTRAPALSCGTWAWF